MDLEYIINNFETLDDVANKFNVSVQELKQYNNICSTIPSTLKIPKVNNSNLKVVFNLNREFVFVGNSNLIRNELNKNGFVSSNYNDCITLFKRKENGVYVVKVLDTLNSVCKKYNLNKEDVIKVNNLKSERLFVGQILKLK